jgi:hypothetical protein
MRTWSDGSVGDGYEATFKESLEMYAHGRRVLTSHSSVRELGSEGENGSKIRAITY